MTEKLDLSRVSREALEAWARDGLEGRWASEVPAVLSRIRAEATAGPVTGRCNVGGCRNFSDDDHGPCSEHSEQSPLRTRESDPELEFWLDPLCTRTAVIRMSSLNTLLEPLGYAIEPLPRAELTGEERAVLEAMSLVPERGLKRPDCFSHPELQRACDAELARRAAARKETP